MAELIPTLTVPLPSRENVQCKALRILLERRLTVLFVKGDRIFAECRGTDSLHQLGYQRPVRGGRPRWWCSCEARGETCSHIRALQYVTMRPTDG